MKITLIGMAGTGKSFWASRFSEAGFEAVDCDRLIAMKLKDSLVQNDGSPMDMGRWMGFPYEAGYREREVKYLKTENQVFHELVEALESEGHAFKDDLVIDTGGSVIYVEKDILERLKRLTIVVHLLTPEQIQSEMFESYIADPRPVLWMDSFKKKKGESNNEALKRCYPQLISSREQSYRNYADITLGYYSRIKKDFGVKEFLDQLDKT